MKLILIILKFLCILFGGFVFFLTFKEYIIFVCNNLYIYNNDINLSLFKVLTFVLF